MKKIIATSVIAAAFAGSTAFADGAQTGLVVGANLGYAYAVNGWIKDAADLPGFKTGNMAGGAFVGYDAALNQMFSVGLELDAQYAYKLVSASGIKLNAWSVPLFLTGKFYIPQTDGLNIFGKAGYAYNRLTVSTSYAGVTLSDDENLWRPVAAAGVGYQIQQFNIFAQYQYNWVPLQGENGGYGTLSGGVSYMLPM